MAAINGVMDHPSDSLNTSAHLGKRKRSDSPEKSANINGEDASLLLQRLRRSLKNFPRYVVCYLDHVRC